MTTIEDDLARAHAAHGDPLDLLSAIDRVLGSHCVDAARAAFERAGARDVLGSEREAIPLYREALATGLTEPEQLRCLVQLASSLRNVRQTEDAVRVLGEAQTEAQAEARTGPRTEEQDRVAAFLALALHSDGAPSRALAVALRALAPHLTRYERAVAS